ncbi:hypothetical protein BVRB_037160 [Beta vulgaris subsp. vulgaris]|uniref:Uncharacterized protein n=1 Tax=Beta vulgaris subsp. vulgaris TaxID=3555 RepID=A0A0J7YP41_BETVV|nr:hypothetical protein BVRB_037160 [Beta vulgaris subsp. vulgaris]
MLLSRAKPTSPNSGRPGTGPSGAKPKDKRPTLESFLSARDFSGAAALAEFLVQSGDSEPTCGTLAEKQAWLAYIYFHLHDFIKV